MHRAGRRQRELCVPLSGKNKQCVLLEGTGENSSGGDPLQGFNGTMKTNALMPVDDHIYTRETSCFSSCVDRRAPSTPRALGGTRVKRDSISDM